jgi:curved DNA-binding protein
MGEPDWYAILGVSADSSADQIQKAWRQQAARWHPDRYRGKDAAVRFQEARKAYDLLIDPDSRKSFDLRRQSAPRTTQIQPAARAPWWKGMESWWRSTKVQTNPIIGDQAQIRVAVSLREVFQGARRRIRLRIADRCACEGRRPSCPECRGTGQVFRWRTWDVSIPPGQSPHAPLRLAAQGHDGPWFDRRGDLLVWVQWPRGNPSWTWSEQGPELHLDVAQWKDQMVIALPDGRQGTLHGGQPPKPGQRWRLARMGWVQPKGGPADAWIAWKRP